MTAVHLILVDDHELMRSGLCTLLENESGFEVIGEASSGREALDLVRKNQPDVVIMDVTMPDMSGVLATKNITAEFPDIKILGLSMHPAEAIVGEMLEAGALGYLTKNCAAQDLVKAVHQILTGKIFLSPELPEGILQKFRQSQKNKSKSRAPLESLSHREREVLQLVAEGNPTKSIADKLFISEKTVGAHRQKIMQKLGIHSVA
ncbi:MAG: response regulator transcription factor, partial [bacterium]|nr:response regulator transcription factor [bacterium]